MLAVANGRFIKHGDNMLMKWPEGLPQESPILDPNHHWAFDGDTLDSIGNADGSPVTTGTILYSDDSLEGTGALALVNGDFVAITSADLKQEITGYYAIALWFKATSLGGASTLLPRTTFSVVPYDALQVNATENTVRQALDSIRNAAGSIDVLVLNSGIYQLKPALETTAAERQVLARVNLEAPIALSQTLIEMDQWKERGRGNLIVISSIMSKGPHGLCSFYAATKSALRNYFQTLSAEEFGWLKVNMILPGGTATDMWKNTYGGTVKSNPDGMMTPERVAHLTTRAVAGPTFLFWEVWVTKSEGMLYVCMSHYVPTLFYFSNHFVAWLRLAAFRQDRSDVIEIKGLIPVLMDKLSGKL